MEIELQAAHMCVSSLSTCEEHPRIQNLFYIWKYGTRSKRNNTSIFLCWEFFGESVLVSKNKKKSSDWHFCFSKKLYLLWAEKWTFFFVRCLTSPQAEQRIRVNFPFQIIRTESHSNNFCSTVSTSNGVPMVAATETPTKKITIFAGIFYLIVAPAFKKLQNGHPTIEVNKLNSRCFTIVQAFIAANCVSLTPGQKIDVWLL